jgi:PAS domain S-box-containing protein
MFRARGCAAVTGAVVAELITRPEGPPEPGLVEDESGTATVTATAELDRLELAALRTMAAAVRDGLSVEGTVAQCLERTLSHLRLDFGCVYVRRHDYLICLATRGLGGDILRAGQARLAAPCAEPTAERRAETDASPAFVALIPLAEAEWAARPFVASQGGEDGPRSWMALPLAIGPTLVGVLVLGGDGVAAAELPPLPKARRMAEPLAVAIENAERVSSLRGILNDTRDVIFRTDAAGRFTYLNAAWQETFGMSIALALGSRVSAHVDPAYRARLGEGMEALVPHGSVIGRQTLPFLVRHRKVRWLDVQARVVLDDRGQVVGTAGVLRDVSRSVRQARDLQEANLELRRRAHELELANEELATADRLKSDFLCNVSHELRTPLAVVLGYTELLADGVPDEPSDGQAEFLRHIREGGVQLERRIQDVLMMASLEAGALTPHLAIEPLWPLLEAAGQRALPAMADKEVALELRPPREPALAQVDSERLAYALDHLLNNAIKFSRRGGRVRLSVRRRGTMVELTITDEGEGLDVERRAGLFAKFVQADGSSTRTHGGLGLGLVLARGLLNLMGGTVDLHSPGADRGATAVVTLPLL